MRRLFVEMLVAPLIWLVGCFAFGVALQFWAGGHMMTGVFAGGLYLGAIGALGEVAYSIVVRTCPYSLIDPTWGSPRLPRWFLVAAWTLVATQIGLLASEIHSHKPPYEGHLLDWHLLILLVTIVPTIVVAYIASWPLRRRNGLDP